MLKCLRGGTWADPFKNTAQMPGFMGSVNSAARCTGTSASAECRVQNIFIFRKACLGSTSLRCGSRNSLLGCWSHVGFENGESPVPKAPSKPQKTRLAHRQTQKTTLNPTCKYPLDPQDSSFSSPAQTRPWTKKRKLDASNMFSKAKVQNK